MVIRLCNADRLINLQAGLWERSLYMRDCLPLIGEDNIDALVKKIGIYYKLMTECLKGGYVGLRKIWAGEMTYQLTAAYGRYRGRHNK